MKLLNKKFPSEKYPAFIHHIYYVMVSITFCYLYYHKFIVKADFYGQMSSGGIYAVLNFEAVRPIQYRLLIPFIFKIFTLVKLIPDRGIFFLLSIAFTYFILLSFYFLLNAYFQRVGRNAWLSPIIIYPMVWNFVIMNGQFFYMDFSVLLIMILGFYFIVSERYNLLLVTFFFGVLNHPSVGYLIPAFLFYNYKRLLNKKTILYTLAMAFIFIGYYKLIDYIIGSTPGYFTVYNLPRNLGLTSELKPHIIVRDFIFNFGGLHWFVLIFLLSGLWKKYRGPMLYINLTIVPYVISVLIFFSIEEIRNYIAIIPFVMILALLFISTFENSFLKPSERLESGAYKN